MKNFFNNYPEYRALLFIVIAVITSSLVTQLPFVANLTNLLKESPFVGFLISGIILIIGYFTIMYFLRKLENEEFNKFRLFLIIIFSIILAAIGFYSWIILAPIIDALIVGVVIIEIASLFLFIYGLGALVKEKK